MAFARYLGRLLSFDDGLRPAKHLAINFYILKMEHIIYLL